MNMRVLIAELHDTAQVPHMPGAGASLVQEVWASHAAVCARIGERLRDDFDLPDLASASVRHLQLFPYVERGASVTTASVPARASEVQAIIQRQVEDASASGPLTAYLRSSPAFASRLLGSVRAGEAAQRQPLLVALNLVHADQTSLSELMDAFTPPRGIRRVGAAS